MFVLVATNMLNEGKLEKGYRRLGVTQVSDTLYSIRYNNAVCAYFNIENEELYPAMLMPENWCHLVRNRLRRAKKETPLPEVAEAFSTNSLANLDVDYSPSERGGRVSVRK